MNRHSSLMTVLGTVGVATSCSSTGAATDSGFVQSCNAIQSLDLGAGTTIALAKAFRKGDPLSIGPANGKPLAPADLCFVKVVVGPGNPGAADAPSTSMGIGIEIWLPTPENWNERYQALGGGGWQGGPGYTSLTEIGSLSPVTDNDPPTWAKEGFVTSATDTGHSVTDGSFAMNPDGSLNETLLVDFGDRAVHEMALATKALMIAFYGRSAKHSYFAGCSQGGRQGLAEVQRHPDDFDGVLSGAPAVDMDILGIADLWPQIAMQQDLGGPMARTKLLAVTAAANAACGTALTGRADGYISDPSMCAYDPTRDAAVLCVPDGGANATPSCLTKVEASAANKIWYGPTVDGTVPPPSVDNGFAPVGVLASKQLWFGLSRGTAIAGQPIWGGLGEHGPFSTAADVLALALGDPAFAEPGFVNASGSGSSLWRTIGYAGPTSIPVAFSTSQQRLGELLATASPDITAFRDRGGKLVIWHGTADTLLFPQASIHYYESVVARLGGYAAAQTVARFYLGPGLDHCAALVPGTNPPVPDGEGSPKPALVNALVAWVETGEPPDQLAAVSAPGVTPVRRRPWCLYPKRLKYVSGDPDTGEFTCE